ncbi:right-handed parallel beta-helix repeat-containing protein [Imperialibacter roseus]|uniref:Right-handed parallel beta-helix repeat-containing protein n=1 Tax=Imperialibacter roseus TaxID=1324217 RepID=A0ABZ0IV86_9BACT|nr:right-handed parallel beta-helix repeat-containing protein [Imperialibacter roseus]WOK07552.1 right-handed parallel beta-helix repeat-containing protein [Imperialibacter roseus]
MKKLLFTLSLFLLFKASTALAQTIYVNPDSGSDMADGSESTPYATLEKAVAIANELTGSGSITIKLFPGLYSLKDKVAIHPLRMLNDTTRFTVEAVVLPDDEDWLPTKMPAIQSISGNNSKTQFVHSTGLLVATSHVTIRGLKFLGSAHPDVTYYYPISKEDESLGDMEVSQCYFVSEVHSSQIQGAIWAQGPKTQIDHCVFYNCRNAILLFRSVEDFSVTNSIIYGANESAVWMGPVANFTFKNNVIAGGNYVWVRPGDSSPAYKFTDCVMVDNQHYMGYYGSNGLVETTNNKNFVETNVVKKGKVELVTRKEPAYPTNYLHLTPGSVGYELNAGIFKSPKQPNPVKKKGM